MNEKIIKELQQVTTQVTRIQLEDSTLNKVKPHFKDVVRGNSELVEAFSFKYRVNGKEIAGFVIFPQHLDKKVPVVVYNRGGTEDFGLVKKVHIFTRLAILPKAGFILIGTQYPGNSLSEGKDERGGESDLQSILNLKNIIDSLSLADSLRIGMWGESRGGMMTYLVLRKADWIKAAVTLGAPTNLEREAKERPEIIPVYRKAFGGSVEGMRKRSAVYWADQLPDIPLLIMHGSKDIRVNPDDSIELVNLLKKYKKSAKLQIFKGGDHYLREAQDEYFSSVQKWFSKYLPDSSTDK